MDITVRVFLIDDEFAYRKQLQNIIQSFTFSQNNLSLQVIEVDEQDSFYSTLDTFLINDHDIFIIDIDLKTYYSGIDIAKEIRKQNENRFILFVTNLDNKGIEIINEQINLKTYLVKGLNMDSRILEEVFYTIKNEILHRIQDKESYASFKKFGQVIFVKYQEILYIKSMPGIRNTIIIHTENSEQIVEGTISSLRETIDSFYLYTELKSYIINLNRIVTLDRATGLIIFDDHTELEVGKRIIYKLKKAL
ncbi:LytR/AlgR family response regulator transcription factor [Enterococcus sp. AZ126]|uniref:LytR/AlgR family response regulator transcription factor n=1 Tax=Enterococcus sp. AZ126 TaxID=2774635 RepID=UPI003F24B64B